VSTTLLRPSPPPHLRGDPIEPPEQSTAWFVRKQRRGLLILGLATLLLSLVFVDLILRLDLISVVVFLVAVTLICIAWRPRVGLYVVFALGLLFENVSPDPLMLPGKYLPLQFAGTLISPMEILLLITLAVWLLQGTARRKLDWRRGQLWAPMVLFVIALLVGMVHGVLTGGDFHIGLWEGRALFYVFICYILAANTVRTEGHLAVFTGLIVVCNAVFAAEGAFRHLALDVKGDGAFEHTDVIFLGAQLALALAQNVFGGPRWQRILGLLTCPLVMYTLLATERRAAYIAIMVGLAASVLVLLLAKRKAFFIISVPVIIVSAIYFPVFWNNAGLLGQPARAVKSLSQPDERDAASNFYRDLEKIDVQAGIAGDPLFGVGFGQPFPFVVDLPDLSFWQFWHYEPHHNILWVWLKTGAIGFALFWGLMGTAIARSAYLAIKLRTPNARSVALLTLAGIVMTLVFCYVDVGLVSGRVTIFLGTLMGIVGVLERLDYKSSPT
jgi:O-Antigen ligase